MVFDSTTINNSVPKNGENVNSSDERKSKNRLYDPKKDKDFTMEELHHIFENYGKIWRGGKYVETADVVKTHYEVLEDAEKMFLPLKECFCRIK